MPCLHVVNRSVALDACLRVARADDVILLIEDGVYAGVCRHDRPLLAIDTDVRARGLGDRLDSAVSVMTYADFVDLVVAHQPVISWR